MHDTKVKNICDIHNLAQKTHKDESNDPVKLFSSDLKNSTIKDTLIKVEDTKSSFDQVSLVLKEKLSQGGFGCVYNATYKNHSVVVKTSLKEKKDKYILEEHKILKLLQKDSYCGIPKVGDIFLMEGRQSFMMQKLGSDLFELRRKTADKKFSLETTLKVTLQALEILKYVHSCGIIHNDIKPGNFMTGLKNRNKIFLIDFGFAESYLKNGTHVPCEDKNKIKGTLTFNTVNCLNRRTLSRRDDLESLAYTLIKMRTGKLPWEEFTRNKEMEKKEKIKITIRFKDFPAEDICKGMRKEFETFLTAVGSLEFEEEPYYDKYYEMFEGLLKNKGFENDGKINWIC